jgi:curved DNA-binding protein
MQFKDYYQTLGIPREAQAEEVKKAFRKLARKYHPDVSKEADADQRMKEINEAYTVLADPEKRAAYDQLGRGYQPGQEFRPPPGWDAGFEFSGSGFSAQEAADFSDFFAELFGRMGSGAGSFHARSRSFKAQGEDHHSKVLLDLEDAFHGATRRITLRVPRLDRQGRLTTDPRELTVKIPKGIREGQTIRLAGQGSPGQGGALAGDLRLQVEFRPHPRFRAEGRDLRLSLPVAPWEAALGAVIPVDMPDGPLKVRIPAGSQSGHALRAKGKGIPSDPPGDLLIEIKVVLPPAHTPKARELYETMARELAFDPRQSGKTSGA